MSSCNFISRLGRSGAESCRLAAHRHQYGTVKVFLTSRRSLFGQRPRSPSTTPFRLCQSGFTVPKSVGIHGYRSRFGAARYLGCGGLPQSAPAHFPIVLVAKISAGWATTTCTTMVPCSLNRGPSG